MFKTTLSTITAIAITLSTLGADTSLSYDGTQANSTTKDMMVVGKPNNNNNSYIENTQQYTSETYSEEVSYGPVIIDEPVEEYRPAPYTPSQVVKPTPSYKDTIIYAKPAKKMFKVGEAIQLRLKLKNKSSLYVWTVGRDGRGYMILPNEFQSYNSFKKNYAYVFPEKSLKFEFQSDRAGTEHVYILATSKPISNKRMKAIFNKKVGNYPTASATATKNFTTKDIHVIAKKEGLQYDIAHIAIQIGNGHKQAHRPIKTDKPQPQQEKRHSNITVNINN